ncbi:RNA-directed DNA polymerase, eukaryota, reverse transcriptase zinc-binding domain protein [Tanacetum coccineum]
MVLRVTDPTVNFFNGILNKMRSRVQPSQIRGVMANGVWIDDPVKLSLINEVQSAFVPDRQILDGPFILNEVLQWCRKKRKHALIFKVDFEKAYDSVRWDFLDDVLDKFGFGVKWRNWIQSCLRSSRGSILINGLGNGEDSRFWLDKWYEGGVLKRLFPRVYALELDKNISVSSKLNGACLSYYLQKEYARVVLTDTSFDFYGWSHENNPRVCLVLTGTYVAARNDGSFSGLLRISKEMLTTTAFQDGEFVERWCQIVSYHKVNILVGRLNLMLFLLVLTYLRRRLGILILLIVPFVKWDVETTSHVFFQCNVVRQLEVVEKLLEEEMLVGSSNHWVKVMLMRLVIWVCSQLRMKKYLWSVVFGLEALEIEALVDVMDVDNG